MVEIGLDEVGELKKNAMSLRNMGDHEGALDELQTAIDRLGKMPETGEVLAELADTYGMRGGVRRRQGTLEEALAEYEKGYGIEKDLDRGSYNLTNTITLAITTQSEVSPEEMRTRVEEAVKRIEAETKGARSDEWWAWSDLGQFYLLLDRPDEARESYRRARETGPTTQEYRRHIVILKELANGVAERVEDPDAKKVSATINAMAAELERSASS